MIDPPYAQTTEEKAKIVGVNAGALFGVTVPGWPPPAHAGMAFLPARQYAACKGRGTAHDQFRNSRDVVGFDT